MTRVVTTIAELRSLPRRPRAVAMTMGALHDGHLELARHARALAGPDGDVVVTVFVNPLQFGPGEDFERYPRQLEVDVGLCRGAGVDVVFAPSGAEMYPAGEPATKVVPGPLADDLEGAVRPGHFGGMLTVVLKLLNVVSADFALFGEKDYQQLTLIRRMAADFNVPTTIVGVPTVREADGLARSSRNVYLEAEQRVAAVALSRALAAAQEAGPAGAEAALGAAAAELDGLEVDYLALRDPDLGPAPEHGPARMLVAVRFGPTRLLDNAAIELGGPA